MRFLLPPLLTLLLAGCLTTESRQGAQQIVISASPDMVRGCKFLGQASVGASSMPIEITRENAITNMRNRAVEMGGTNVVSAGPQVTMPGPAATMNGDVYRCG